LTRTFQVEHCSLVLTLRRNGFEEDHPNNQAMISSPLDPAKQKKKELEKQGKEYQSIDRLQHQHQHHYLYLPRSGEQLVRW
jgi:hypothetical protein